MVGMGGYTADSPGPLSRRDAVFVIQPGCLLKAHLPDIWVPNTHPWKQILSEGGGGHS